MSDLIKPEIERREKTPAPEWVERVCADFGVMESGAPRYRVIWNPDRTRMCFGREIPKYPRLGERWILETLLPWEIYGHWDEHAFGPKPADGEYCHCYTFQHREGELNIFQHGVEEHSQYLSLDDFGQDSLRLLLAVTEQGKAVQAWQVRDHTKEMIEADERREHEQFENAYDGVAAELDELDKLCEKSGLHTGLDPLPASIEKERRRKAKQSGKMLIH